MSEPLTVEELRKLEKELFDIATKPHFLATRCRRAVRELIACKESMEQEQQGMPWKTLHKNSVAKLLRLEARHDRLRRAAEATYHWLTDPERGGHHKDNQMIADLRATLEGK